MDFSKDKMVPGQPNWDEQHSSLIDDLNSNLGGVNLKPSDTRTDGLVWLNNARNSQATWYRTTELGGGYRIVELALDFTGISAKAWEAKEI
uniref:hypothetical protein n=1 Tax=Bartonella sp. CL63NXGY TaxID=3243538 RepID=UPI0035CF6615